VRDETCSTCKHWEPEDHRTGKCHRFPPQLVSIGTLGNSNDVSRWPLTGAKSYCGEWSPVVV